MNNKFTVINSTNEDKNKEKDWDDSSILFLKKNYGILPMKKLVKALNRTEGSIRYIIAKLDIKYVKMESKYQYVYWNNRSKMWNVGFEINGEYKSFGSFANEDEAGKIAMEKAKEYGKAI